MNPERHEVVSAIVNAAEDRKAEDIVALDVREVSSFADTFVVITGTSDRHVRSITDAIRVALSGTGESPVSVEGYDDGRWVLVDFGDTIVHIFQHDTRLDYDLERLWSDASRIEWISSASATSDSPYTGAV
jgi:ribosome-associated protein